MIDQGLALFIYLFIYFGLLWSGKTSGLEYLRTAALQEAALVHAQPQWNHSI